jgi:hypothetical protein
MEYPVEHGVSPDDLNEMEERRVALMDEAGIDERQVLHDAKENINLWESYFNENIVRGKDDQNFVLRDQWTAIERSEFTRLFKPAMTFNKLYDATKKIAGEQRKNKPDLIVRSLTGKATQEQINLRADLVRTISYQSQNDLVYQTAFRSALMMGFGAFQVGIDYETPISFLQRINFTMIPDATRTSFDPSATKPHKGDGNFCGRQYLFDYDEFDATFPYARDAVSYADPRMLIDFQWETKDSIVVCDYYQKEWFPVKVYKLSNGKTVTADEWEKMQADFKFMKTLAKSARVVGGIILDEIPRIVGERMSQDYTIMHYRLCKNQILDFARWPSRQLPIIFVDGDSYYMEGRQYTKSFVHEARDAQKFINYVGSEIAAEIKNRRREQWLGTPDNIKGFEQEWRNPEVQVAMLRAVPDPKTGQMPAKQPPWDLSQQLIVNFQRGGQDIKEILGVSESEELQGRDISGKARRERKVEGSMSAYVYLDNLNQAIEQAGRVVLDLLPVVYGGEERHVIISKKDGQTQSLVLNQKDPKTGKIKNELSPGEYDIEIDTGPSFAVQKADSLEIMMGLVQANPQVFPLIADLISANLDLQFMPQIKERLQTLVPPQILAKEQGLPPPPPQPDPQQQMMQQQMQVEQANIENKKMETQIKAQKLKLEQEQNEIDKAKMMLEVQKMQLDAQLDVFNHNSNKEQTILTHTLDNQKLEHDFNAKIAKIISDLHDSSLHRDHEAQQKHHDRLHEKELAKEKSKQSSAKKNENAVE